MRVMGVDEAGRGPVLGPLVMGAVVAGEEDLDALRDLGVRDSKALTRKARERIYDRLMERFKVDYVLITPAQINRRSSNLNRLEFHALCRLMADGRPDRIVVDAFMQPKKLTAEIKRMFPEMDVVAEWKADVHHPIVSAASIIAKVVRDREIERLKKVYGDIGSGYPSDPLTRRWLLGQILKNRLAVRKLPPCVRFKWSTLDRLRESIQSQTSDGAAGGASCQPPEDAI